MYFFLAANVCIGCPKPISLKTTQLKCTAALFSHFPMNDKYPGEENKAASEFHEIHSKVTGCLDFKSSAGKHTS